MKGLQGHSGVVASKRVMGVIQGLFRVEKAGLSHVSGHVRGLNTSGRRGFGMFRV